MGQELKKKRSGFKEKSVYRKNKVGLQYRVCIIRHRVDLKRRVLMKKSGF